MYTYDQWAWVFVIDRLGYGISVTEGGHNPDALFRAAEPYFVAPRQGDFRFKSDRILVRGSDNLPAGVRWADWQWDAMQQAPSKIRAAR